MVLRTILAAAAIALMQSVASAIDWPTAPRDSAQPIGNSWGEYQDYSGYPYLHPGIDIMCEPGQPVYAVAPGFVKAVLTTSEELHWRVAIGEFDGPFECDGWLYAHLEQFSITVNVGDWVSEGELLGTIVYWPVADFHHLHFAKIRQSGEMWQPDWEFIQNPMVELSNVDDFDAPVFLETPLGGMLAFCQNETSVYFALGDSLSGKVDIIARVYDMIGHPTWRCTPHCLEYLIKSDTLTTDTLLSFISEGQLFWASNVGVQYKNDAICNSEGDYVNRDYYFILTNSDGDSVVEASDADLAWVTNEYPNDYYTVVAKASDIYGNTTYDSMTVRTANYFDFSGSITVSDGNPDSSGASVRIPILDMSDSCDNSGAYNVSDVPAGTFEVSFSRLGYNTVDTMIGFSAHVVLDVILDPASYVAGDADASGEIDIDDAVLLINYIFSGGPAPAPYGAGDPDGSGAVDIDDVVWVIEYIFGDGTTSRR